MTENIKKLEEALNRYDKFDYCLNDKLNRNIEENRKGYFTLKFTDADGNPVKNATVKIKQISDELRFSGFFGKYEVEIDYNGKKQKKQIDLFKDNTGYDNRLMTLEVSISPYDF